MKLKSLPMELVRAQEVIEALVAPHRVGGQVIEVPIQANTPIEKGAVLFRIDRQGL